jgi:DNA-binding response OmpR family regulator
VNILIVEDDPVQRGALERLMREYGHEVCWASTSLAALELLRTERIDLILLDFELDGELDGRYVAKHVARQIPVFMISGHAVEYMREKVSNTLEGVTLFFAKPVDTESLMIAIDRVDRTRYDP